MGEGLGASDTPRCATRDLEVRRAGCFYRYPHSRTARTHSELRKPFCCSWASPLEPHFPRLATAQSCKVQRAQERRCPLPLHCPESPPQASFQTPGGVLRPGFLQTARPTQESPVSTFFRISRPLRRSRNSPKPKWQQASNQAAPQLWRVPPPCLGRWSQQAESPSQDAVSSAPPSLASGPVLVTSLDISLVSPSANHFTDSGIFEGRKAPSQPSHLKSGIMSLPLTGGSKGSL